ncbi:hypothetical protein [Streptomyces vilmorinianum]|uniref:hypothetical protein n=1 Tax=Streptomyces vilmorinianum TaxID=3051092 RepID=UPI001586733F|nr:hypothetical protein [Streptomyces vilmorinianum]
MPVDPFAVLHALLRAEAARAERTTRAATALPPERAPGSRRTQQETAARQDRPTR